MIHGQYGQPYTFYTTTEEKRIDKSVPTSQIRFLFKFTNGMDRDVVYAYGQSQLVNNRYTKVSMTSNTTERSEERRVGIGKLYIKEPTGGEEVQYEQYVKPTQTNYIYVS